MQVLVDTNVLLRLADSTHVKHDTALNAVNQLEVEGHPLYVVPQVVYEFWTVATRTHAANGLEYPTETAEEFVERFTTMFTLLRDERAIYESWLQLVTEHQIRGVNSFDTRLAAAMMRHRLTHLLTFNERDFRKYGQIETLSP